MANEAKKFASAAIRGAHLTVNKAEKRLKEAIDKKGLQESVEFPDTKFYLPVFHGLTGEKIEKLVDMKKLINEANSLLSEVPAEKINLPYLGQALDAGIAAIFAQEVIEALDFIIDSQLRDEVWLGAPSDTIVKEHGSRLLEGKAAGFTALFGSAPSNNKAKKIALELTKENFYIFMAGSDNDFSMAQQLKEEGIELGWNKKLIPFDSQIYGQIFTLGFAVRTAMILGKINPGDYRRILEYCRNNIFGFFMVLNEFDDEKYAAAAGAISFGFLTMAQAYVHQLLPIHTLHRLR